MNIYKFIFRNSFVMLSICAGGYSYIVITKGEGGDTFLGICSFAITLIFAMIIYRTVEWLAYEMETHSSQSSNFNDKAECYHSVQSIISLSSSLITMPKAYLGSQEYSNHNSFDTESEIAAALLNEDKVGSNNYIF